MENLHRLTVRVDDLTALEERLEVLGRCIHLEQECTRVCIDGVLRHDQWTDLHDLISTDDGPLI